MNFLDTLLILFISLVFVVTIIIIVDIIKTKDFECIVPIIVVWFMITFMAMTPFIVVDKYTGVVTGKIIKISTNYFGTTNVKFRLENGDIDNFCIEDVNVVHTLENIALNTDHKIDLIYNKRVGLYSTGKCHRAPINGIAIYEDH